MVIDARARFLITAAGFVVIVAGLRAADRIVVPFLVALFVSILSLPLLFGLQRRGMPHRVAIAITMLLATVLLVAGGFLFGAAVNEFADRVPAYQEGLQRATGRFVVWLQSRGLEVEAVDLFNPDAVVDMARATMGRVALLLQDTLLVIIITIFILFEAAVFPAKLRAAAGSRTGMVARFERATADVQRYLVAKTLMSAVVGLTAGVWTWMTGVDYPFFWGLLAFLLHYIPNIGAFLSASPATLLALATLGAGRAAWVAVGFLVIHIVLGTVVEPPLLGHRNPLSTLVVFLSLVFWGWVWGPVGMLLSVPLTMIVKILLENSRDWHWLAVMLGAATPDEV